jgi:hypothetical protein
MLRAMTFSRARGCSLLRAWGLVFWVLGFRIMHDDFVARLVKGTLGTGPCILLNAGKVAYSHLTADFDVEVQHERNEAGNDSHRMLK